MEIKVADVAELVDARDLKSLDGNVVWVRVPPPAPIQARGSSTGAFSVPMESERKKALAFVLRVFLMRTDIHFA
jgi:hypothetical protein